MCEFLCHCTLLFWLSLQGDCEGPKIVLFFSLTWMSHMERTLETIFLFWFRFTRSIVKVQKESYSFHLHELPHMDRTRETNFCFGLVCKVVAKVQRSSISLLFSCTCVCHMYWKLKALFWLVNFINLFHNFILLIILLCPMERQQSHMLSVNKTCLLNGDLQTISIFSLRLVPISELCGQFLC